MESSEKDKSFAYTTEDAENDIGKKDEIPPYERKYFALLQKCELVKQTNERLVNRIYCVKRLLRRRKKERKFLMDRLDNYGDDYRSVASTLFSEMIGSASPSSQSKSAEEEWYLTRPQPTNRKDSGL